ncbi:MAG: hypothetical protein ACI915_005530 [Gammaproteobacteria bacterium]|jgi:hypothetical protein
MCLWSRLNAAAVDGSACNAKAGDAALPMIGDFGFRVVRLSQAEQ